ncbi:MAG: hypothetical protein IJA28_06015, partial [Coprobacter sp.]|nr:hypothetical protein [Coprobacter sp.]
DTNQVRDFIVWLVPSLLQNALTLIAAIALLFTMNWKLTVIIVLVLTISFYNKRQNDTPTKDYRTEIEEFKSRVVLTDTVKEKKRSPRKKTKKVYTPNEQQLSPLKKESK